MRLKDLRDKSLAGARVAHTIVSKQGRLYYGLRVRNGKTKLMCSSWKFHLNKGGAGRGRFGPLDSRSLSSAELFVGSCKRALEVRLPLELSTCKPKIKVDIRRTCPQYVRPCGGDRNQ